MKELPSNLEAYKKTPVFTEKTVPNGLLKAHSTKAGIWGKICVTKGKLLYVIEVEPQEVIELRIDKFGVVEPEVLHHVEADGEVEFFVEFFR